MHITLTAAFLLAATSQLVDHVFAHSWVEQTQAISENGSFAGNMGYPRGYVARTDSGFNGNSDMWLLPSLESGRTRINNDDLLCHPAQRTQNYTSQYAMQQVSPGTFVSMKYLENGHVSLPQTQKGKPQGGGTVFVYGTTTPKDDEKIADVLKWTSDGKGGDARGTLLTAQNFDDGRCHQINSGEISTQRQQQFPDRVPDQPTSNVEQWCETDVKFPENAAAGSTMTIYWIWQWPTEAGADPTYPDGKDEYYTTCLDMQIQSNLAMKIGQAQHTLTQQDPQTAACKDFASRPALQTSPGVTLASGTAYGSSSTAAPTTSAIATATASTSASTSITTPAPASANSATYTTVTATVTATAAASAQPTSGTATETKFVTVTMQSPSSSASAPAASSASPPAMSSSSAAAAAASSSTVATNALPYVTLPGSASAVGQRENASPAAAVVVGVDGVVGTHKQRHIGRRGLGHRGGG